MDGVQFLTKKGFLLNKLRAKTPFNLGFIKRKDGSMAVEFAFVAIPFFWMIIGMVELSIYFTTSSLLAESANVGARIIRTGQINEMAGDPYENFKDVVCDRAAVFIPCEDIQFEVAVMQGGSYGDFSNHGATYDEDGNLDNNGSYQGSTQNDVVMVRLAYRYPFLTPFIGSALSNNGDNTRLILNTILVKNEPYQE